MSGTAESILASLKASSTSPIQDISQPVSMLPSLGIEEDDIDILGGLARESSPEDYSHSHPEHNASPIANSLPLPVPAPTAMATPVKPPVTSQPTSDAVTPVSATPDFVDEEVYLEGPDDPDTKEPKSFLHNKNNALLLGGIVLFILVILVIFFFGQPNTSTPPAESTATVTSPQAGSDLLPYSEKYAAESLSLINDTLFMDTITLTKYVDINDTGCHLVFKGLATNAKTVLAFEVPLDIYNAYSQGSAVTIVYNCCSINNQLHYINISVK